MSTVILSCSKTLVIPRVADCVVLTLTTPEQYAPDMKEPGHMYLFGNGENGMSNSLLLLRILGLLRENFLIAEKDDFMEMDYIVLYLSLFYMSQTAASAGNVSLYYFTRQQSDNILLPYEICER